MSTNIMRPVYIDELGVNALLGVHLVGRQPMISSIHFVEPIHPDRVDGSIDWRAHVADAVKAEALFVITGGAYEAFADPVAMDKVRRTAARYPVADDTLQRTVDAYRRAGASSSNPVRRVADELHVSERTAHRYVKRAREAGVLS